MQNEQSLACTKGQRRRAIYFSSQIILEIEHVRTIHSILIISLDLLHKMLPLN